MALNILDLMRNVDALLAEAGVGSTVTVTFRAGAQLTGTLGKHADMPSGSGNWVSHFQPWTVTVDTVVHSITDLSDVVAVGK